MRKVPRQVKAIIDSKWNKCIEELNEVKDVVWPKIDIDVTIWDVIVDTKALPSQKDD